MTDSDRPLGFARRVSEIEPFRVVEVLTRATELAATGRDIVLLAAGEPDFATAAPIVEAGRAALARGATHYSQAAGIPQLREALSRYYADQYGLDVSPQRIMVTPGASGALLLLSALLMNPGDTMLMTDPGYPCNRHFLRLGGGSRAAGAGRGGQPLPAHSPSGGRQLAGQYHRRHGGLTRQPHRYRPVP